jgi:uncharacterized membrane protein
MSFYEVIETVGKVIDGIGVAVIALGAIMAGVVTVRKMLGSTGDAYKYFREQLGRSILLGLEFLVAADIIRTVALTPTWESVLVLAGIVLIRTFLSFSLEVEISGRWPWQQRSRGKSRPVTDDVAAQPD